MVQHKMICDSTRLLGFLFLQSKSQSSEGGGTEASANLCLACTSSDDGASSGGCLGGRTGA